MAGALRQGGAKGRAGTRSLSLLRTPLNASALRALADGPQSFVELQARCGSAGSTLRTRVRDLLTDNLVAPSNAGFSASSARFELTEAGEDLLFVADVLERWLDESPTGSRPLGGEGAKAAVGALIEAWSATLLRALAVKSLSISELDGLIQGFNYPSLERRVTAMRLAGQVEASAINGRETPYAVTGWLRRGVAPLLAGISWERSYVPGEVAAVAGIDVEAMFLLALPLVDLDEELSGECRLVVELPAGDRQRLAGVLVALQGGSIASCTSRLDLGADAWASGSVGAWCRALIDHDLDSLELGGDGRLARATVDGLHRALFAGVGLGDLKDLGEPALKRG